MSFTIDLEIQWAKYHLESRLREEGIQICSQKKDHMVTFTEGQVSLESGNIGNFWFDVGLKLVGHVVHNKNNMEQDEAQVFLNLELDGYLPDDKIRTIGADYILTAQYSLTINSNTTPAGTPVAVESRKGTDGDISVEEVRMLLAENGDYSQADLQEFSGTIIGDWNNSSLTLEVGRTYSLLCYLGGWSEFNNTQDGGSPPQPTLTNNRSTSYWLLDTPQVPAAPTGFTTLP